MNDNLLKTYREQAALHKLLANESRLAIIDKLNSSEANVSELTKITGLDQSTVSKHLSLLYNAGLIDYRKSGNQIFLCEILPPHTERTGGFRSSALPNSSAISENPKATVPGLCLSCAVGEFARAKESGRRIVTPKISAEQKLLT